MEIIAFDNYNNKWTYELTVFNRGNGDIISLGSAFEWYADDLLIGQFLNGQICIDASGHNHSGNPVYVSYKEVSNFYISFKIQDSEIDDEYMSYEDEYQDMLDRRSIY